MTAATTFILADNQDITYTGFITYLAKIAHDNTMLRVSNKKELISALMDCSGSCIIVIDYTLFDMQSMEELLNINQRFNTCRWILFSNELSESLIRRLSSENDFSMLLKESSEEEIVTAIKCTLKKDRYLCHHITNLLLATPVKHEEAPRLTATETDILRLIAQGKTVKEIANMRSSSIHTITTHKKNIFRKLEVNNVYEATKYALRAGIIEMMEYYI